MKKGYLLALINFILILVISNRYPKNEFYIFLKLSLPMIAFLLLGLVIIIKLKKPLLKSVFFIQNIILLVVFSVLTFAVIQTQIDETKMHFNPKIMHKNQKKIESIIQAYIRENAMYPESYKPIEFGNLDSMQVKILNLENHSLIINEINKQGIDHNDFENSKNQVDEAPNYFIRHSYKLRDFEGDIIQCVAFIQISQDFEITSIDNEKDFVTISWKERYGK